VNSDVKGNSIWACICDCGEEVTVLGYRLKNGHTKSCGCYRKDKMKAKYINSYKKKYPKAYSVWRGMKNRCYNSNSGNYENYGGRGIFVCDRWKNSFKNFIDDMGVPGVSLTIERIDNDDGYHPDNCKWASYTEQSNNKRSNVILEYQGKSMTLKQWSIYLGMSYWMIHKRYRRNYSVDEILKTDG
jgi:hypothetical protein